MQVSPQVQDVEALSRFELFFITGVSTVLIVRAFLIVTGYPRVGGGELHVAHVLWGGLLMGTAIIYLQIAPGNRAKRRAAVIGGIGFGLFIDEVGKFLTKNVNYFFRPAIAIIYAVFVGIFLVVREVVLRRPMSDQRRLAVAAAALSDLALGQLHDDSRRRALAKLDQVSGHPELVAAVRSGLTAESPCADGHYEMRITNVRDRISRYLREQVDERSFTRLLFGLLTFGVAGIVFELVLMLMSPGSDTDSVAIAAVVSTGLSAPYTVFGMIRLARGNRAGALRVMFRATLLTVLFTQVAVFFRYQISGVVGLFFGLAILAILRLLVEANPTALQLRSAPTPRVAIAAVP